MKKPAPKAPKALVTTASIPLLPALVAVALLIAICCYVYLPGLKNGFVYDDVAYVSENAMLNLKGDARWDAIWSQPVHGNYHPLTMLTLAWDYDAQGLQSTERYHITNLLLHILNSILAGVLIWTLFRSFPLAAGLALLFAAHPLRVESVAWISERKDVLYAFFFLLTWISLNTYRDSKKWIWYGLALLFFVAACLSKGMAVVLPPMVLLGWYFQGAPISKRIGELNRQFLLTEMSLFFITSLIFGIIALKIQQDFGFISDLKYTAIEKFFYVCYGLVFYPVKTLLPIWLSSLYPYPMGLHHTPSWEHYASLPALLLMLGLVWYYRRHRVTWFIAGGYLLSISIVLQVIPVGGAIVADRYAYIATLPLLAGLVWVLQYWDQKLQHSGKAIFAVLLLAFTWQSHARVQVWERNATLFMDVAEKFPKDPLAFYNTANAIEKEGRPQEAIEWYQKALKNMPDYIDALYNTGSIYGRDLANPDSGIYYLRLAVQYDPQRADAWNNLGVFHFNKQQYRDAVSYYNRALGLKDSYMEAWFNLGNAYVNLGIADSAKFAFEQSVRLSPSFASAHISLGNLYANEGNQTEQIKAYQQAARLGHTEAQAWLKRSNLNW
jgi:tetratricopeptide (TPR) repeat protein